ncbi:PLP-dependent aminotransferase family protein [Pseudomonas sp. RIT-PI-S]|uniref:aminotransferase-like domain-containing protein n=1 Tax=Pseudomonas sp. RIT-PI-S TaxID=3035295 RepID=UPI0021D971B9|nr:PLP-dependent aminotransferase family protein [Pseudomonas sp. RIT-PI-S]
MQLQLDRESTIPLVEQLVQAITLWLEARRVRSGARMPSIRQVARAHAISVSTVVEAYARLVARGALEPRHGSGFFVSPSAAADHAVVQAQPADERWAQFEAAPGQLRLGCGWVPDDWRDDEAVAHAIRRVTREEPASLFSYNAPLGLVTLRQQVQRRLAAVHVQAGLEQILTTQGASHGLDLIVRTLLSPGDTVIVEDPGYYNLFNLLALHRIRVLPVPRLRDGPDAAAVEALLREHRPRLMFINSMYHNPTGTSLAPSVAHRLLKLAEQHGFQLVEDDIYADFQNGPSTRLAALDGLERVLYLASFSKTLSCSLRVGYLAGPAPLVQRLGEVAMCTGLGSQRFAESVVADLLASGAYRRSVSRLRQRLAGRMADTLLMLAEHGWDVFTAPEGGMFVWARFPGAAYADYTAVAGKLGIVLSSGNGFRPNGEATAWLRLNVAYSADPRARAFLAHVAKRPRAQP